MKRPAQRRSAALALPALMMALLLPAAALAGCTPGSTPETSAPAAELPGQESAGPTPAPGGGASAAVSAAPASPPQGNYADPADFTPAGEVEGLADRAGICGYGSDTGYYSFRLREDASANLCYLDYASGREIVLCSQPNCTHDSDTCPAWYPFDSNLRAVPVGETLFVLQGGSPNYLDLLGEDAIPKLRLMQPDGSDRREVFSFPASSWVSTLPRGGFARDDANFYFTLTDQGAGPNARTLCAADSQGRVFALCALPEDEERIAGGDGQALILTCLPDSSRTGTGQELVTRVLRLDLNTLQQTELLSHPLEDLGVCGEGAYHLLSGSTLLSYSLTDGSLLSQVEVDAPNAQTLYGVVDGRLLVSGYTDQGEPLYYALDVATGQRTDLPYIFRQDNAVTFGEVLTMAEDRLVCVAGSEAESVTYPAPEGQEPMRSSWQSPAYALVSSGEFWAGAPLQAIPRAVE